jgi:hypothetical protein
MPLTVKVYNDFYMKEAIGLGLNVEYWDITDVFFKNKYNMEDSSHLCPTKKISSYKEIGNEVKKIENLTSTLFISIMTFEPRISKLYRILTKHNCTLSVFGKNIFPVPENIFQTNKLTTTINFRNVISSIKSKWFERKINKGKIKKYDIIFQGGTLGWKGIGRVSEKDFEATEIVKVNSDDYDSYLKIRKDPPFIKEDYIMFLDEYLPLHPDTKLFNIKNIKPEDYYPELCSFFDRVEQQFNMPIVIAAHPKALRYKTEDFFGDRKVVFDKTANLAGKAHFVIAHDSTSINYPVAFGKKIHFISSKNIRDGINIVHKRVICFSNYLGCNWQWFDNDDDGVDLIRKINALKYENYKYNYQTWEATENTSSRELFINFLNNTT